ncbi:MAG: TlpA family protein disulfide reductase [Chitinophagaceae bacterium]|nr:MAG: TlpA family protein disulfide reductase [Chitinophagaceae bacterium]
MKFVQVLPVALLLMFNANAQSPQEILEKTATKIIGLNAVKYTNLARFTNPLSNTDTGYTRSEAAIILSDGKVIRSFHKTDHNKGESVYGSTYTNQTAIEIDYLDSTFTSSHKANSSTALTDIASSITTQYLIKPERLVRLKDSIVNRQDCFQVLVKTYDTINNGKHYYTWQRLLVSKKLMLPVYTRLDIAGSMGKEGYEVGIVSFFNEEWFENYRLNGKISDKKFAFDSTRFTAPNKAMLVIGDQLPAFDIKTQDEKTIDPSQFANKPVLVEFGSTSCVANALVNPMMNRMIGLYDTSKISIFSVFASESAKRVSSYVNNQGLKFPVYLAPNSIKRTFKTMGTPNFYLADKNGKIVGVYRGYYDKLEEELTKAIKAIME